MKLYTEKQVLNMLRSFHNLEMNVQLCMLKLTPIELPSDEEIEKYAVLDFPFEDNIHSNLKDMLITDEMFGFEQGAKWVINKIKGGNQ